MKEIFNVLCQSRNIENEINLGPELVEGYTEEELMKMERLYDVKFSGDLRDFMLEMGRSDGGLLGDDPISLYSRLSVRRHVFFQAGMDDRFFAMKKFELRSKGSFIFSVEYETQYYFLLTKSDRPDLVYRYNDNFTDESDPAAMISTGMTFMDYMHRAVRVYTERVYTERRSGVVCRGEMIVI